MVCRRQLCGAYAGVRMAHGQLVLVFCRGRRHARQGLRQHGAQGRHGALFGQGARARHRVAAAAMCQPGAEAPPPCVLPAPRFARHGLGAHLQRGDIYNAGIGRQRFHRQRLREPAGRTGSLLGGHAPDAQKPHPPPTRKGPAAGVALIVAAVSSGLPSCGWLWPSASLSCPTSA